MKSTVNHEANEVASVISNFAPEFAIAKHELTKSFLRYFALKEPFGFNRSQFISKCVRRKP